MKKDKKIGVGSRVWLLVPHNGKVKRIYKNGSLQIELDPIEKGTLMARFKQSEVKLVGRSLE